MRDRAACHDGFLEVVHQAVQVDRHDRGGADGRQRLAVAEPARTEIPAALGARAQVAPDFRSRPASRRLRGLHVLQVGLVARRRARIPVAIQDRAVGHRHHVRGGRAARRAGLALHPVRVLLAQRRQVFLIDAVAFLLGGQLHHVGEERRLRAARVVGAIAVRHMADGIDQVREVVEHVVDQVLAAGFLQAQHREVAVPVVALAEAPARHHVGLGQRDQRAVGRGALGGARQVRPQPVDVRAQRLVRRRRDRRVDRRLEVLGDEVPQREARRVLLLRVEPHDGGRVGVGRGVDEGLLVGIDLLGLHGGEQFAVQLAGRRQHAARARLRRRGGVLAGAHHGLRVGAGRQRDAGGGQHEGEAGAAAQRARQVRSAREGVRGEMFRCAIECGFRRRVRLVSGWNDGHLRSFVMNSGNPMMPEAGAGRAGSSASLSGETMPCVAS